MLRPRNVRAWRKGTVVGEKDSELGSEFYSTRCTHAYEDEAKRRRDMNETDE